MSQSEKFPPLTCSALSERNHKEGPCYPAQSELVKFLNTLSGCVTGVLVVWATIFVVGYLLGGDTPGRPLLHVFVGFLLGMLAMLRANSSTTVRGGISSTSPWRIRSSSADRIGCCS